MDIYTIHFSVLIYHKAWKCYRGIEEQSTLSKAFTNWDSAVSYGKQVLDERAAKIPEARSNGKYSYIYEEDGVRKLLRYEICRHELVYKQTGL